MFSKQSKQSVIDICVDLLSVSMFSLQRFQKNIKTNVILKDLLKKHKLMMKLDNGQSLDFCLGISSGDVN